MEKPVQIFIADSQRIMRDGLRKLLHGANGYRIIGEAADGIELVRGVVSSRPDILLTELDIRKTGGLHAIREVRRQRPETMIIVLTDSIEERDVLAAYQAGVKGYVSKREGSDALARAIECVLQGQVYVSPWVSGVILQSYLNGETSPKTGSQLTLREREILDLIEKDCPAETIADLLCISKKTVLKHRSNILKKNKARGSKRR